MLLGYKVNTKGIKVCPDKVDAVLSLPSPKCLKDVQKLNGKLASLNRFLTKSAEKSQPFFKTLKKCMKKSDLCWTDEAESAFKQHVSALLVSDTNIPPYVTSELHIIYLTNSASWYAVLIVLPHQKLGRAFHLLFSSIEEDSFFCNDILGPEVNYTSMEKLVLALVHASKRLKRYFQAHPIIVITDQPIKQVLSKPEVAGRLQKWSIELGEYAIHYRPRISVKGQILADFIVERPEEDSADTPMKIEEKLSEPWILFTDGSSCADGSGAGLILTSPEGMEFTYALRFGFEATNNEAEYEALIAGLRIAEQMGIKSLQANVDSRLVANQVNGTYIAKEADMIRYLEKVKTLTNGFRMFTIKQVPRSENKKADALSKIASTSFAHLSKQVLVEELKEKSINKAEVLAIVEEEGETWMTPIHDYITGGILPAETDRARAVKRKSQRQTMSLGKYMRDLATCTQAQDQWPFPKGPGKVKFLIVAIDYFTKWIEAKPVATITGNQFKKIVWDNIVCRFGLPGEIISDNGKQFRDNPFKDWCEKLCIRQRFASVKHPRTNGLVERANRSLGERIKARLEARSKNWMEEISHVLWAHRTMIKSSNEDTHFSLTYGTEAVIPTEIGMPILRTTEVDVVRNDEALEVYLDLLEEKSEQAAIREAKSKRKMEKYYNAKVRSTSFKLGDLVYRNNDASHAEQGGKLGPKWEGPYEVTEALGKGAYKLRGRDGKQLPRTWNIRNLKKCYVYRT
ncbi:reverse transcriptase domain-containing protein [Tanacetum coccineum]